MLICRYKLYFDIIKLLLIPITTVFCHDIMLFVENNIELKTRKGLFCIQNELNYVFFDVINVVIRSLL